MFRRSRRHVTLSNMIYYLNIEEKSFLGSVTKLQQSSRREESCVPKKERTWKGNHFLVLLQYLR